MNHRRQFCAPAISPGQKWWLIVLEIKISCSQWKGSACTHEGSSFFLLGGGERDRDFFVFSLVPNVFISSSQCVPRCVPQDVPNSTWVLSHMVCPKFNSPIYKLKRWNPGVHICFYFASGSLKRCFYWGHAQCSQKIADGPINMAPLKKKKIKLWVYPRLQYGPHGLLASFFEIGFQ
jgi:hypothetical protein